MSSYVAGDECCKVQEMKAVRIFENGARLSRQPVLVAWS
jgi:hypothetical protein